jgi:transposase
MPQAINCSGCGYVLYEGEILRSPQDIIKKYEGKCPNCGKTLVINIANIIITNVNDVEREKKKTT